MFLSTETQVPFDAPIFARPLVSFSQFLGLLLSVFWQTDILTSVQMISMLWHGRNGNWPYKEIHAENGSFWTWMDKVLLPNMLRLTEGVLVLLTSFVIIVKSDDVMDLFKEFTGRKMHWNISNILKSLQCFVIKVFLTDILFSIYLLSIFFLQKRSS